MARARLSSIYADLRGTVGKSVLAQTKYGLAVRGKPKYKYPVQPAVKESADRFSAAQNIWSALTFDQAQAWQRYAQTITKTEPVTQKTYSPTAHCAFIALATKYLQVNPAGSVPVLPPDSDFLGDDVVLEILETLPTGVRFRASGANASGVVTEILAQRLPNVRRSPTKFYKSAAFHSFASGALDFDLSLDEGVYAFAYRFVRAETGQSTHPLLLGMVVVEDAAIAA
jgi:hypothetical protein